jgi:predicted transcriptional regulator
MRRAPLLAIRSPADWLVLISPARTEITEALRLLGPCSISEIAASLNRPADSLYRHIEALCSIGAVRETEVRKVGRRHERVFDLFADDFTLDFQDGSGARENAAIVATANTFLKATGRAVRDSAAARQIELAPDVRNIVLNYETSWLTHERFKEVRRLTRELKKVLSEGRSSREGRLYVSLSVACPVTRRRGAKPAPQREPPVPPPNRRTRKSPISPAPKKP